MKKIIFGTILLSSPAMQAMIVPVDNDTHISRRSEDIVARLDDDASIARAADQQIVSIEEELPLEQMSTEQLSQIINFRGLGEPLIIGDIVQIPIFDFVKSETALIPVGEGYSRQYALQKTLLRYEHNLVEGFSNPVHELSATVNDIEHANRSGKIVVDDEYLDDAARVSHQRRATGQYEMDDANLSAKPFTEIFIIGEHGEDVVDSAKVREGVDPVAYIRTDTPAQENIIGDPEARADDAQFNYQRTETLEDWRRPDGTIFTKRTEEWRQVAKPPLPAPVPPPIQYKWVPKWVHQPGGTWYHHYTNRWQEGNVQIPASDPRTQVDEYR